MRAGAEGGSGDGRSVMGKTSPNQPAPAFVDFSVCITSPARPILGVEVSPLLEPKFALVEEEDGFKDAAPGIRPRALMFFTDGGSVIRTFAGRWVGEDRIPFDVIMPEDLREFRKASDMELSDLFQDFSATPGVVPIRSKAATKASL